MTAEKKTAQTVEVDKEKLDAILAGYDEMKSKLEKLEKKTPSTMEVIEQRKIEREQEILEKVRKANAEAEQEVEIYIDAGSLRSNKNLELNINGNQYTIPKGQLVKVSKAVADIIENSKIQHALALGVQEAKAKEAQRAIEAGMI